MPTFPLRYTGPRPFTERESDRFFGRDEDIEALVRTIRLNRMTVLTGKSGMGKSSLLQAGVVPQLEEEGYTAIPVRFEAWEADKNQPARAPDGAALRPCRRAATRCWKPLLAMTAPTLWQYCKAVSSQRPLLLVFDRVRGTLHLPR